MVTAHLIHKLRESNRSVFNNSKELAKVSTYLATKITKLDNYINKNYAHGSSEIFAAMVEVADKFSLFDYSIYGEYLRVKEALDRFPFLESIYSAMRSVNDGTREMIVTDLLKYNKYKVNLEKYVKNPEAEAEAEIEETDIDDSINN